MRWFTKIKERFSNSFWTLADQCMVSGSNFLLGVLIVAIMGISDFGVFSLYWMIVLLISSLHQALVVMPLYALYPKAKSLKVYFGAVLREQIIFSMVSLFVCIFTLFILKEFGVTVHYLDALLVSFIAGIYTLQDFFRRVLFVMAKPTKTLWADALGFASMPLIVVLLPEGWLNITSLLALILITKIVSVICALMLMGDGIELASESKGIRRMHWDYSKYLFASGILQWCSGNIFILFSGVLIGPVAIGALRIAQNLFGLLNIFFLFLENTVPIRAANILHVKGAQKFRGYMMNESRKYFFVLVGILVLLCAFHDPILRLFFGTAMDGYMWLIPVYCILYLLIYLGTIFRFVFRTIERNNILFHGYVASSFIGLSLSYPLINSIGLYGVMVGLFLTQLISIAVYMYHLKFKQ